MAVGCLSALCVILCDLHFENYRIKQCVSVSLGLFSLCLLRVALRDLCVQVYREER